jgi:asparagine synthase (glutamine-hydrolysing)
MCGIAGFTVRGDEHPDLIRRMCDLMRHRGPDDEGYYRDRDVVLGMRRLSIIDVAGGHQPVYNEDRTIVVVLNGEIYNYIELREQFLGTHVFGTASDTEVLVHLYEEMGDALLEHLNGMYAFALWDARRRRLLVARDRIGVKQLYYHWDGHRLIFASELKPLLACDVSRALDWQAFYDYLTFMYVPGPRTMFASVRKLESGSYLIWTPESCELRRYWTPPVEADPTLSETDALQTVDELFADAVNLQLRSDVPVGTFLSGGIDSSAVVAFESRRAAHPVTAFSVGFEGNPVNELPFARVAARAFGTIHHELIVRPEDGIRHLPRLIHAMEEPHGDSAMLPTWLLSEFASKRVKVVLNGTGGDELFGGYDRYCTYAELYPLLAVLRAVPGSLLEWIAARAELPLRIQKILTANRRTVQAYLFALTYFERRLKRRVLRRFDPAYDQSLEVVARAGGMAVHESPGPEFRAVRMRIDLGTYLQDDLLLLLDKMTMAHSLEGRVPFLDHRLVEYVQRIPSAMKLRPGSKKRLMKRWLRGVLPDEVLDRPKWGFGAPVGFWFRHGMQRYAHDILLDGRTRRRGIFNTVYLEREFARDKSVLSPQHRFLLLNAELWFRMYMDGDSWQSLT